LTLKAKATVYRHTKGHTLYISIPSKMAQDSAFPFKKGDKVTLEVVSASDPGYWFAGAMMVKKVERKAR
jgi:hypothetical protein